MRAVQAGPVSGLIAQVALLAALAGSVGLSGVGWVVGIACGLLTSGALSRGLSRYRVERLGPADWVTLVRATLVGGIAALTAVSLGEAAAAAPLTMLMVLTVAALVLDAVDGWVARRTRTTSALGARFDGEVDAFLILVLSVYVAPAAGAWVLAIGAARYLFLVAGWLLPWLRDPLPPRYWRKVVAAIQGVVLAAAAADVLPPALTQAALVVALALLAESFGRDVWWLWSHRHASPSRVAAAAGGSTAPAVSQAGRARGRVRTGLAVLGTVLAVVLVWVALVAPNQPSRLTPGAFARLPIEGVVVVALALVLPVTARRVLAGLVGLALGLLVLVKILDIGFFATFDRPFDPVADWAYTGIGVETLRDSFGRTGADLTLVGAAVLGLAVLVFTSLAVLRLTRVAAGHRRPAMQAVAALGAVWLVCAVSGVQLAAGAPIASTSASSLAYHEVGAVRAGVQAHAVLADEIAHDRFRATPADQLLTGLRGKDVILAFVESYGRVAVQDSDFSPHVRAVLRQGNEQLRAAGFSAQSAFLTSATFGGISWLAHSTLQSGLWIDSQRRYDQLVASDRFTLSQAFNRAGWRTVGDVPSNNRGWQQGTSFYGYDKVYDRRNVGYRGPKFAYASMPDQYVLSALHRLELAKPARRPVFAEVDLVSSHEPWTRIPHLIDWSDVGDGSVFNSAPVDEVSRAALWSDRAQVRAAYGRSIEYTMSSLVSYVQHYGDDNLVLVVLGDHQPWTTVTGQGASHDVPISVIAHDPSVMGRISGWGWQDGLLPSPHAPVWPMDAFRDRFLRAFGSQPATP